VVAYREYYSGDTLIGIDLLSRNRISFADTQPILPLDNPFECCTKKFLESAFAQFRAYDDPLWLKGAIHYFVTAQGSYVPLEASVIIQAIIIESLCNRVIKTFKK